MFTYPFIGPWKEHAQREHTQHRGRKTTVERQRSLSKGIDTERQINCIQIINEPYRMVLNQLDMKTKIVFFLKSNCINKKLPGKKS